MTLPDCRTLEGFSKALNFRPTPDQRMLLARLPKEADAHGEYDVAATADGSLQALAIYGLWRVTSDRMQPTLRVLTPNQESMAAAYSAFITAINGNAPLRDRSSFRAIGPERLTITFAGVVGWGVHILQAWPVNAIQRAYRADPNGVDLILDAGSPQRGYTDAIREVRDQTGSHSLTISAW